MDSQNPNPQPMRVLIRPPTPNPPPPPPPTPPDPLPAPPLPSNGVVVVGFIGKRHIDVTQLINRIIDDNIFGSGNLDTPFRFEKREIEEWFKFRSISFYHEEEKGILYLQFSSISCPVMEGSLESKMGFDSVLEDIEFGDLQAMLFMFSVCHVVIFIQEGSRFDTQIFKNFRVLQAAKHAMSPFVKSHTMPPLTAGTSGPSSSRASIPGASSNNPSPNRSRGILNRSASAVTLMSGLGPYSSLLPGQCTPVILFVFLDNFSDHSSISGMGEQVEPSSFNQLSSLNNVARPSLPPKGSASVVVLARRVNKSEGGSRKKLQSSLESQVRFTIKRCRLLSSSETGQTGSRTGGVSSSAPLFLLDASKAVVLLDLASNQKGESLDFASDLVEDVLDGKATSDSLLLESNGQTANKDDILSVKEFIFRQSDILRGRGGIVSSTNSGSAAGVGMVAVAAAAAAASAASGKTFTPELPSFETWLSSSQPILYGILSGKQGCTDGTEISKRKPYERNAFLPPVEGTASKATDSLEIAISFLESGRGLNSKFSTSWCERTLPVAKEIYLNELPPCYPTSQHKAHLERALLAFNSMVKGPAVQLYIKKLEDECTSIWCSGRQLCDAVSLTGKACMHKRHDLETDDFLSRNEIKPHSSGYVFLHACACGRSRRQRLDPFDFETANVTFNSFSECDKLLPALELPQGSLKGPIQPLSWKLIRIGGSKYYTPAKGLLQSGFCTTQKFLFKWNISIGKQKKTNVSLLSNSQQVSVNKSSIISKDESITGIDVKKPGDAHFQPGEVQSEVEIQKRQSSSNSKTEDKTPPSVRGISNSTIRKPFSEVVAGSAGPYSGFPPLQTRKQALQGTEKVIKQHSTNGLEKVKETAIDHDPQNVADIVATDEALNCNATNVNGFTDFDPILQIGSNVVLVNKNAGEILKGFISLKHVTLYVGFEHECPHGHRFILSPDHLNDLGSPYTVSEESPILSSFENSEHKTGDPSKFGKNGNHANARRQSKGPVSPALRKAKNLDESKARDSTRNAYANRGVQISTSLMEQAGDDKLASSMIDLEASLRSVCLDDGGCAFNLLNRSLPIYMNCPHCRDSKKKKDAATTKFAGTISQLQRIFLVTPPFPVVLAACPVVQFEESCLPPTIPDRKNKLQFGLGCRVILPPDSFLSLRLPFVYGVELEDRNLHPITPFEDQPQLTAWITKGTALQVVSEGSNIDEGSLM